MRRWMIFFVLCVYSLGVGAADPLSAPAPSVKIKITHIHDLTVVYHHDDRHNQTVAGDHEAHHHHHEHQPSAPHSHEVSVSMAGGIIFENGISLQGIDSLPDAPEFTVVNDDPPKEFSPGSIFRPPIV